MNQPDTSWINRKRSATLATNSVLRNTYLLLSLTLLTSALTAGLTMMFQGPMLNPLLTLVIYFGLLMATQATRNSGWGLFFVFALTGFLGYTLGPILNVYIHQLHNGSQIVMTALGSTGAIFLGLSLYALTTRKNFSFLRSFLFAGILIAFLASLLGLFFHTPALVLAVSSAFALLSSGMILWQTSEIIHGGETNYIVATVTLYVSIFNLFISLLNILGILNGRD